MPAVMVLPTRVAVAPPVPLRVTVDWKARCWVEAATVETQARCDRSWPRRDPRCRRGGHERARRVQIEEGQLDGVRVGSLPPPMEKLITSTRSMMACCAAATESESKQPSSPHTL
jgi:hypothetical protein